MDLTELNRVHDVVVQPRPVDDVLDRARTLAARRTQRVTAAAVVLGVAVLVAGGSSLGGLLGGSTTDVLVSPGGDAGQDVEVDVLTREWDLPDSVAAAVAPVVAPVGDGQYLAWGADGDSAAFDPENPPLPGRYTAAVAAVGREDRWSPVDPGPLRPRADAASARLPSGEVLVIGGTGTANNAESLADGALFDPATRTWRDAPDLVVSRSAAEALVVGDKVVVVGGVTNDDVTLGANRTIEVWDGSGSWRLLDVRLQVAAFAPAGGDALWVSGLRAEPGLPTVEVLSRVDLVDGAVEVVETDSNLSGRGSVLATAPGDELLRLRQDQSDDVIVERRQSDGWVGVATGESESAGVVGPRLAHFAPSPPALVVEGVVVAADSGGVAITDGRDVDVLRFDEPMLCTGSEIVATNHEVVVWSGANCGLAPVAVAVEVEVEVVSEGEGEDNALKGPSAPGAGSVTPPPAARPAR